jgi:hypothetical protein
MRPAILFFFRSPLLIGGIRLMTLGGSSRYSSSWPTPSFCSAPVEGGYLAGQIGEWQRRSGKRALTDPPALLGGRHRRVS